MRDTKRNVRAPGGGRHKPVAPSDLWLQMDALVPTKVKTPPPDSFTAGEFKERKGLQWSRAREILAYLVKINKLSRVKVEGKYYYTIV